MEGKSTFSSTYLPSFSFRFLANAFLFFTSFSTSWTHLLLGHPIGLFPLILMHFTVALFYTKCLYFQTIVVTLQQIYQQILHSFLKLPLLVLSLPSVSSVFPNIIFDAEILLQFPLISTLYHAS